MRPEQSRSSFAYGKRGSWLVSAAGIALYSATAGCGGPPPASQFPTADDALGRLKASYACAMGVSGTAKIDLVTKKGRVRSDVDLTAVTPAAVRFEVLVPGLLSNQYTMTSDGKDFKFADFDQKIFFHGPAKQCNLARFTQIPVPPHALTSLLRGEAPVLVHTKDQASIGWDGSYYKVVLNSKNDAAEEIHIGVHPDDFAKPWAEQRVRLLHVRVEQGGNDLYEADLASHESAKTAAARVDEAGIDDPIPPSGPQCSAELPKEIRFRVPGTKDDVIWDYKEAKWNPPLVPGAFDQVKPGGMADEFVDCPEEAAPAPTPGPAPAQPAPAPGPNDGVEVDG